MPAIEVPDEPDRPHRLVRATRKALGRSKSATVDTREKRDVIPLHVSRELVDRALRIMHALLTEAQNRGHEVETRTDLHRGEAVHKLVVVIHGHALPLAVTERTSKMPHEPTPQEIRRQQHSPWTQIPKYDLEFNGRLEVGAPAGDWHQRSYTYSDGARWALESRLGRLLRDPEGIAASAERQRQEEERRKAEQRRQWYAAVAQARERQVERHRAETLAEQVKAWRQADGIRAFCQAARARAEDDSLPPVQSEWLEWTEAHAERIDPLSAPLRTPRGSCRGRSPTDAVPRAAR
ncbi:hypothetical protein ACFVIY_29300 [Streptomyces sp. NPDC127166]|uniref:hypothetical protein n=1 Tax=Streptomyces sp. NPDC127166 TaxID=3345380 RepID=UPI003631C636